MSTHKVAVSIDRELLEQLDWWVAEKKLGSRSQAIQIAVQEMLARLRGDRLSRECAKLDPAVEGSMAEEGLEDFRSP